MIYSQAKELFPLSETTIRGMHQQLLRYFASASPYIGRYKIQTNSVIEHNPQTKQSRTVFKTADAGPITEASMTDLIAWYNEAVIHEPHSLTVVTEFVFRFLAIHPFQDGNGRLGRALFLLAMLQSRDEITSSLAPYLAIDRYIEVHKTEYYYVLNKCSNGQFEQNPANYHIEYFFMFMLKILKEALDEIPRSKRRFDAIQELSPSATLVLDCFRENPEIRLTNKGITESTSLPRRTINSALSALLREQLIQSYGKGRGVRYQLLF